jgi:hypothetical protein
MGHATQSTPARLPAFLPCPVPPLSILRPLAKLCKYCNPCQGTITLGLGLNASQWRASFGVSGRADRRARAGGGKGSSWAAASSSSLLPGEQKGGNVRMPFIARDLVGQDLLLIWLLFGPCLGFRVRGFRVLGLAPNNNNKVRENLFEWLPGFFRVSGFGFRVSG